MDDVSLINLVAEIATGSCPPDEAVRRLKRLPFADLGFARIDHHRGLRQRFPESVFGPGKLPHHCAAIIVELLNEPGGPVILTRANPEQVTASKIAAEAAGFATVTVAGNSDLSTATWRPMPKRKDVVTIVTAGTADLPVADECHAVLSALGFEPKMLVDCGVAGIHRLLASVDELAESTAVVVVAGMEGALASVVGGIASAPVVAVPTSTGYGASFEGVTALLSMLASCAAGITVVGIDNGFGAACAVARMLP